ncbi:NUDIX hydrolase [Roseimarinus sediminis]|jgi:mutator protein MutT|uniref:NUDIX hydrolase n=1 Tax=Roseimarinus sediminis TaxID=1610899 RepID=UPI003D19C71B
MNKPASPVNHYKYCPRCASRGDFDEENQAFKCHACGFHFFLNSSAAVTALIFNSRGELLMARRAIEPAYGQLDLPGGFIDPGENAEEALLREVKEELDLVPSEITYYGSFANEYLFSGTIVNTVDLVFKCKIDQNVQAKSQDDIMEVCFIHPSKLVIEELPFRSVRNIIKKIRNEQ